MPNNDLMKYAGMATQFLATLGVAIFIGVKADRLTGWKFPACTILLPLAAIVSLLYKIYLDSTPRS